VPSNSAVDVVFRHPVVNSTVVEDSLEITKPSALKALKDLADAGLLTQRSDSGPHGQLRWQAPQILAILNDD